MGDAMKLGLVGLAIAFVWAVGVIVRCIESELRAKRGRQAMRTLMLRRCDWDDEETDGRRRLKELKLADKIFSQYRADFPVSIRVKK